jgi:plasmid stability protein
VADLLVRGVDETLVKALKKRAGASGRSAEAEHRAILVAALLTPKKRSLAELLASMPEGGRDQDFERQGDGGQISDVFG